ncbi:MAG: ribosome silencing factor [Candidatus Latescibacteria bacterium]|nr:ribosome silencing factor [Candidatus Latescibacterota bacterium]
MEARRIVERTVALAHSRKAEDVVVLDMRAVTDMTDYFVICTGTVDVHVKAIADAIVEGMKDEGERSWHLEGTERLQWVLIDFVDVVVHVFQPEMRDFYALERLWGDAKRETMSDEKSPSIPS